MTWSILVSSDDENGFMDSALQHEFIANSGSNTDASLVLDVFSKSSHVEWPSFPWDSNESSLNEWEYQRRVILEEFPIEDPSQITSWLMKLLNKYVDLEKDFKARVIKSKERDDSKGAATIPNYAECHVSAYKDLVVHDMQNRAERVESMVKKILSKLRY
jgi:hypothetical protein